MWLKKRDLAGVSGIRERLSRRQESKMLKRATVPRIPEARIQLQTMELHRTRWILGGALPAAHDAMGFPTRGPDHERLDGLVTGNDVRHFVGWPDEAEHAGLQ